MTSVFLIKFIQNYIYIYIYIYMNKYWQIGILLRCWFFYFKGWTLKITLWKNSHQSTNKPVKTRLFLKCFHSKPNKVSALVRERERERKRERERERDKETEKHKPHTHTYTHTHTHTHIYIYIFKRPTKYTYETTLIEEIC